MAFIRPITRPRLPKSPQIRVNGMSIPDPTAAAKKALSGTMNAVSQPYRRIASGHTRALNPLRLRPSQRFFGL